MDIMAESENRTLSDKFMLRLPDGLRDRIKAFAESRGRSMNAEIVRVLERAFPAPRTHPLDRISHEVSLIVESLMIDAEGQPKDPEDEAKLIEHGIQLWADAKRHGEPLPIRKDVTGMYRVRIGMPRRQDPHDD